MNFSMNHAPGEGLFAWPVDLQSRALLLYYDWIPARVQYYHNTTNNKSTVTGTSFHYPIRTIEEDKIDKWWCHFLPTEQCYILHTQVQGELYDWGFLQIRRHMSHQRKVLHKTASLGKNQWCFRPRFCTCKPILDRGQPWLSLGKKNKKCSQAPLEMKMKWMVFQDMILNCKAILGREQPGQMIWILLWS